jgi:hypothetical protein
LNVLTSAPAIGGVLGPVLYAPIRHVGENEQWSKTITRCVGHIVIGESIALFLGITSRRTAMGKTAIGISVVLLLLCSCLAILWEQFRPRFLVALGIAIPSSLALLAIHYLVFNRFYRSSGISCREGSPQVTPEQHPQK